MILSILLGPVRVLATASILTKYRGFGGAPHAKTINPAWARSSPGDAARHWKASGFGFDLRGSKRIVAC